MRNMKRALSLVLTMVMLLGMVMIPTGAVGNFADAALIENTEAVAITSGIGLFAGTSDGNFAPKATVTRAQMATIIVKMLRGNEFNADAFKGVDKFPDTASFEGGWAEGYINACVQLGVVAGYGDGTFKPGRELTTAEAITMIINALGIDPGAGEWPVNYMAKAEALKLYGDLVKKPGTNEPLSRDQLAVIVWEGLQYSPEGKSGYKIPGSDLIFAEYKDALRASGSNPDVITETVGEDSLASKVYEIKTATGWITGNAATGKSCTVLTSASGVETNYAMETGVDMLGHYVTIYYNEQYKTDEEPGLVYTIVDESTVVTVKEAIGTAREYKAAFGKSINVAQNGLRLGSDYTVTEKLGDDLDEAVALLGYTAGSAAPEGTYIIADGVIVTYIDPVTVYASYVVDIDNAADNETIWINDANGDNPIPNAEGDDQIVEYAGVKIGDFVTYVKVQDVFVLSPVEKVIGTVTRTALDGEGYETITIDGTAYPAFEPKGTSPSNNKAKLDTKLSDVDYGQTYTLYVTEDGHYIGFEAAGSALVLDSTVFLLGNVRIKETDQYGKTAFYNKGRGIDMDGNEAMIILGKAMDVNGDKVYTEGEDPDALGSMSSVLQGYYSVSDSTDTDEKKEGIQVLKAYPGSYSLDTPTYTLKPYNTTTVFNGSGSLATEEGIAAYGKAGMKFFVVGGSVTDSAPLTVTAAIPSGFQTTTEVARNCYMLVTRTADGSRSDIDVFVYLSDADVTKDVYFYATQEQLDTKGQTADGVVYTVYTATDAKETEIIVDPDVVDMTQVSAGMLKGQQNGDGIIVKVEPVVASGSTPSVTSQKTMVLANLGYIGVTNNRLRAANQGVDFFVTGNSNNTAGSAGVVDLRSEGEITDSGVPEITSLNQLATLRENDPGLLVVISVYAEAATSSWSVKTIFIEKAVRRTVGFNGIVYVTDFDVDDSGEKYANAVVASSSNYNLGDSVKVYADVITEDDPGFYIYTVDASGKIVLEPYFAKGTVYQGYSGMIAEDEKLTALTQIDKDTLQLVASNAHSDCGVGCNNQYEALKAVYVTSSGTRILDATDGMKKISLSEFYQMYRTNDLELEYFCDSGVRTITIAADTSAELVVITGKDTVDCSCDGKHEGWTAVTGSSITGSGNYYLTADLKETLTISGDVTLCMNGHNIQPKAENETDTKNAVVVSAGKVELISCGRPVSQLVGVNASAVSGAYTIVDPSLITERSIAYCEVHKWHEGWEPLTGTALTSGKYYLAGNTTASGKITISGDVTLCLGKNTLTAPADTLTSFITVPSGAKLTIEADEGGTIKGGGSADTRGIYVDKGTLVLNSGTITGFVSAAQGGGVYNAQGKFYMNGGTIAGNKAQQGGGVLVNVNDASAEAFVMTGGIIGGTTLATASNLNESTGNYATGNNGGGGLTAIGNSWVQLKGGKISYNQCANKAGGAFFGGTTKVDISGIEISYNKSPQGGGVQATSKAITMSGGKISYNVSTGQGGGVYLGANASIKISGDAEISGNTSGTDGGGIHSAGGIVTIEGGKITQNTGAPTNGNGGGGVSLFSTSKFKMTGGEITGNTALTTKSTNIFGGGLFVGGSVASFELSGGTISGNTLADADSGLATRRDIEISGGAFDDKIEELNNTKKITISGGKFSYDPTTISYVALAEGKVVSELGEKDLPYTHEVK